MQNYIAFFLVLLWPAVLVAEPLRSSLDPARSILYFDAQTTLHSIQGHVKGAQGETSLDKDAPQEAKANLEFLVDSLFTGVGMRDRKMQEGFLDDPHYPKIAFTMTRLSPLDSSRYEVRGTLAIHGKSKEASHLRPRPWPRTPRLYPPRGASRSGSRISESASPGSCSMS